VVSKEDGRLAAVLSCPGAVWPKARLSPVAPTSSTRNLTDPDSHLTDYDIEFNAG
jgi:hypothetical protein